MFRAPISNLIVPSLCPVTWLLPAGRGRSQETIQCCPLDLRPSGGKRNFSVPFPFSFWPRGSPGRGGQEVGAVGWDRRVLQFGSSREDTWGEGICRGIEPGGPEVVEHQTPARRGRGSSGSANGSSIPGAVTRHGPGCAMGWDNGILLQTGSSGCSEERFHETAPGFMLLCQWGCGISPHQPCPT